MEKLRFGIIGCGVIGPTHAKAIEAIADAELVAVADIVPERAERLAGKYEGVKAYSNYQEMLEKEELDVVDVCTPSGMHAAHAIDVLESGRHVIVEKPVDIQLDRIDRLIDVQRHSRLKVAVISQHRFSPDVQKVKRAVEAGVLGRITMANSYTPWWRSAEYYRSGDWRGTWELDGGGALMNQSIHYIDLIQWVTGGVASIRAYMDTLAHDIEVEDVASATVRYKSGALGVIQGTTAANPGLAQRFEVFGDAGCVVVEGSKIRTWKVPGASEEGAEKGTADEGGANDPAAIGLSGHAAQINDMVQAIREDREPLVNAVEGRKGVAIILGIYESARTGKEVVLD